jgi:hypothetical protein
MRLALLAVCGALTLLVAGPALAAPVYFVCGDPVVTVQEDTTHSRYGLTEDHRVFELPVAVNTDPPGGFVEVKTKDLAACEIRLPNGSFFRQSPSWVESPTATDHTVYPMIHVAGTGGANTNDEQLSITPTAGAKSGLTVIEFRLYFVHPGPAH